MEQKLSNFPVAQAPQTYQKETENLNPSASSTPIIPKNDTQVDIEQKYSLTSKIWDIFEYLILFFVIIFLALSIQYSFQYLFDRTPGYDLGSEILNDSGFYNLLYIPLMPLIFIWFYFGQIILYIVPLPGNSLYPDLGGDGPIFLRENIFFFFIFFSLLYVHIKYRTKKNPKLLTFLPKRIIGVIALIYSFCFLIANLIQTFFVTNQGLDISIRLTLLSSVAIFGFVTIFYISEILEYKYTKIIYGLSLGLLISTMLLSLIGINLIKDFNISTNKIDKSQNSIDPPGDLFSDLNSYRVIYLNKNLKIKDTNEEFVLREARLQPSLEDEAYIYGDQYLRLIIDSESETDLFDIFKIKFENGALYDAYSAADRLGDWGIEFMLSYPDIKYDVVYLGNGMEESFKLDFSKAVLVNNAKSENIEDQSFIEDFESQ